MNSKQQAKAFVTRWEVRFYCAAAFLYLAAVPVLIIVFPDVSNLAVSILILGSGFLSTIAACASAIKTNDTTE